MNGFIRITPIRLIGAQGEQIGVVETADALRRAQELGLDLVEIAPTERPPICKIMDYGKFKYEQSKQQKKNTGHKAAEMKEVRLGRSIKIGDHDVQIRINQSRRFLVEGHKVMVTQRFKGREIAHRDLGLIKLREVADALADIAKVEQTPRWMGKQASIILAPDKVKVDAYKRKLEKEKAERAAKGIAEAPEPEIPDDIDDHDDDEGDDE
ncbi:MAG: translation initiation factor IF-3 [Planctomycetes bacterium]|nr:translation initiation factor IF-3 [Planctomycetota bacterium]